jgi:hypothetical protein
MPLLKQILPAVAIAMMVAAGICSLAFWWRKEGARRALGPLAVGLAYGIGHFVVTGWVSFPPTDTTNWLPYFALGAAALGATQEWLKVKTGVRVILFALITVGALRLLLKPKFQYGWTAGQGWLWLASLALSVVVLAVVVESLAQRTAGPIERPAYLLIVCAGTVGALTLSGSILLGQLATALAAAIFGTLVLAIRRIALGRGVAPVVSLLLGALLISGYFFAALPATSAALLIVAPVPALIPVGKPTTFLAFLVRAALVSVPVAAAVILAFRSSPPLDY